MKSLTSIVGTVLLAVGLNSCGNGPKTYGRLPAANGYDVMVMHHEGYTDLKIGRYLPEGKFGPVICSTKLDEDSAEVKEFEMYDRDTTLEKLANTSSLLEIYKAIRKIETTRVADTSFSTQEIKDARSDLYDIRIDRRDIDKDGSPDIEMRTINDYSRKGCEESVDILVKEGYENKIFMRIVGAHGVGRHVKLLPESDEEYWARRNSTPHFEKK